MRRLKVIILLPALFAGWVLNAQELTIAQAVLQNGLYPQSPKMIWGGPAGGFLKIKGDRIISVAVRSKKESVILEKAGLDAILTTAGLKPSERFGLPEVLPGGAFRFRGTSWMVDYDWESRKLLSSLRIPDDAANLAVSPDGLHAAFTRGQNVFITDAQGTEIRVTADTAKGIVNGQSVSRDEFGISAGLFWSADGKALAFYRKDESAVPEYPLTRISEVPAAPAPIRYPMAGGPSESVSVGIYNLRFRSTVYLDEQAFGPDRYLTNISWDPSGTYIYAAVLNREQNHMLLNQYETLSGRKVRTLFEETSDRYVEPLNGLFFNPADPGQFVWISERDGYDHLYLYRTDGSLIRQLTKGQWAVTGFNGWDAGGKYVYIRATDPSPLERHVYRIDVKSGERIRLTAAEGTHDVSVSPDGRYAIDSYSSYTVPRRILLTTVGKPGSEELFNAPDPLANLKMAVYKSFTIKAADRKTDLYGYLVLPPDLDTTRKYPVIVYVYGGPHAQLVTNSWMGGASGWQHYMALNGFICMTLDNRGSDGRGRDFEQVIHRNLGKAETADQMEGIHFLSSLPYADMSRIGVHGWSYGGFMTTSLMLDYPDVYKVGVAGGPVTDWKFYEVMYGERYMDRPGENPEGYASASTLGKVRNLRGRLMMIHGDVDPTVVWQNSLAFLKKCVDEGKLVDYMVYPGHPHNVRGTDRVHLMRTVTRYFQDNL